MLEIAESLRKILVFKARLFDLIGHSVLATQGLLGHCTFCNGNNVLAK